jgi:vitamin B12 transporter
MAVIILFLTLSQGSWAQEEKGAGEYDFDDVVLSATKTNVSKDEIGTWVTVITEKEIIEKGKGTVLDLLRDVPGLSILQCSGFGGTASIYLRGSKPGYTLVMIDGVEVNDPMGTDRSFDFGCLTTDNIERIEVIRGQQSTLYGSDAIGGIVNIITKKGRGKAKIEVSGSIGTDDTFSESVGVRGGTEKVNYSLSLSRLDSEGISKADRVAGETLDLEKDGFENTTISSRLGFNLAAKSELDLSLRYTEAKIDVDDGGYDDDPNHTSDRKVLTSKLGFKQLLSSRWDHKLSLSFLNMERNYRDKEDIIDTTDDLTSWYKGENKKIEWQNNFLLSKINTLTAGFEWEEEKGSSSQEGTYSSDFSEKSIKNTAGYLQNQCRIGNKLFTTLGLRADEHELFGTQLNYKISCAYFITETNTRLKINWGTGFKAPSLFQLYSYYGNTELKPDESKGYDLGVEQGLLEEKVSLEMSYFHNDFENMIDMDTYTWEYKNIGNAWTDGFEVGMGIKPLEGLKVKLNYTYTQTEDKETKLELLRRPVSQSNLNINWDFLQKGNVNLNVSYIGEYKDIYFVGFSPERATLGEYALVYIVTSYDLTESLKVFVKINNLLDRKYQEIVGYSVSGAAFYGGIKAVF